jgi:hypothetical protein
VHKIKDIIQKFRFPLNVRLVYGCVSKSSTLSSLEDEIIDESTDITLINGLNESNTNVKSMSNSLSSILPLSRSNSKRLSTSSSTDSSFSYTNATLIEKNMKERTAVIQNETKKLKNGVFNPVLRLVNIYEEETIFGCSIEGSSTLKKVFLILNFKF